MQSAPGVGRYRKAQLGQAVVVSGHVSYNDRGEPVSVQAQRLRTLKEDGELPTVADMTGLALDLTGDLSTEEYIRVLRDD